MTDPRLATITLTPDNEQALIAARQKIGTLIVTDGRTNQQLRDAGFLFDRAVRKPLIEHTDADIAHELYYRARTLPAITAYAGTVTLACVDCVDPQLAACALDLSRRGADFARVLLLSHERPAVLPVNIDWVQIPKLTFRDYQLFCLRDLWRYTYTSHVLTIETDGWIVRPERWQPAWLQWDYIGSPWQPVTWAARTRVGNSGCCLRSRRLLKATARLATDEAVAAATTTAPKLLVDWFTANDLFDGLTAAGCRFAPPAIAAQFATEETTEFGGPRTVSFGYHSRPRTETAFLRRELPLWLARTRWRESGSRLRVVYNRYTVADPARQAELDACLQALRENSHIDQVIEIHGRPTFDELFHAGSLAAGPNDVTVLLNSDCHLDETAADFASLAPGEMWCLTRHELDAAGRWHLWETGYSQDAWAWSGRCEITGANFVPGTIGCDNRLMYMAHAAGYTIRNPARQIRVCHRHAADARTALPRLPGPYATMPPHALDEPGRLSIDESPDLPPYPAFWRP